MATSRSFVSSYGLVLVLSLFAGCRTTGAPADEGPPTPEHAFEPESLLEEIQTVRDRAFDAPPEHVRTNSLEPSRIEESDSVVEERRLLADYLFDLSIEPSHASPRPLESVARHDPESHRILVSKAVEEPARLRAAFASAVARALNAAHFDPLPAAETWDGVLARRAVLLGERLFLAARMLLPTERFASPGLELLAAQPELTRRLSGFGTLFEVPSKPTAIESADALERRLTSFAAREGVALASALYRANGWSGVELLRARPPTSTLDVVRPDRWMTDPMETTWRWPSPDEMPGGGEWNVKRTGTVGPALAAIWLGQSIPPERARSIYAGWGGDGYRYLERRDGDAHRFEWLTHWETPSDARRIVGAFERVLNETYAKKEASDRSIEVVRHDLTVAVVVFTGETDEPADIADALAETEVELRPRSPLPTTFEPTRRARFQRISRRADRREGAWRDPAAGVSVDLSTVSSWTFRKSRTPPLRWFARTSKGGIVEMSVELADPFAPAFGSEAYLEQLRHNFERSFEEASVTPVTTEKTPFDPTFVFTVRGTPPKKSARERRLRVWHFQRDDVLVTLSYQAPSRVFTSHLPTIRRLVGSIEPLESTEEDDSGRSSSTGDGIIEFETEEDG